MFLCLKGAFANMYFIGLVYFVPLAIKQVEHLLPNKLINILNWIIHYQYLTYSVFGFFILNNLFTIAQSIITMVNNPL